MRKAIEKSDEDDYVTGSEDVKGIEWYSTDHPGETIVYQLYRQNAELKKEVKEIRLISRKAKGACFQAGEKRYALQEELDTYKAGEEKWLERLKEEAEVAAKWQYQKGYEKAMEDWYCLRVEAARWQ